MTTSEAAIGRWPEIFKAYHFPEITGKRHYKGPCPLCGKKNKFRIDDKNGKGEWICVCGHGNGFELLIQKTGREFLEICEEVNKIIGHDDHGVKVEVRMIDDAHDKMMGHFKSLQPIKNSPAEIYLKNRGIKIMPRYSVRYSTREYSASSRSRLPAMFCLASSQNNKIKYTHCTFLIGHTKANIESPKQMHTVYEYSGSVAVKMFRHKNKLGIAEGVETALSAAQMFKIPTWSVLNTSFMKRFIAPDDVEELYIFADNDLNGTGLEAAFGCGRSNILKSNNVKKAHILWPLKTGDFNDILLDEKPEVMQWTLIK